jgi:hypothetical protein
MLTDGWLCQSGSARRDVAAALCDATLRCVLRPGALTGRRYLSFAGGAGEAGPPFRSMPAAPLLRFTRSHASHRTSLRWMRSYSASNRRVGDRLAAAHSRRWSWRTWSRGFRLGGELDRVLARSCPRTWPLIRHIQSRDPSLPGRFAAPGSSLLRSPRTPAPHRSTSPSAYTSRLAATTAAKTGLSRSVLLLPYVPLPIPR